MYQIIYKDDPEAEYELTYRDTLEECLETCETEWDCPGGFDIEAVYLLDGAGKAIARFRFHGGKMQEVEMSGWPPLEVL